MLADDNSATLATDDVYCQGAPVLGHSLSSHRATGTLAVLLTSQVSDLRTVLWRGSNKVIAGNQIGAMLIWPFQEGPRSGSPSPRFTDGFLPHHRKCVSMDVGPLVLSNSDELFDRKEFSEP